MRNLSLSISIFAALFALSSCSLSSKHKGEFANRQVASPNQTPHWIQRILSLGDASSPVFLGENSHSLPENKALYKELISWAVSQDEKMTFSTEYVTAENDVIFQEYLKDLKAQPGSLVEKQYFSKLHHLRSSMTTPEYDQFFQSMRSAFQKSKGQIHFCGIDVKKIKVSKDDLSRIPLKQDFLKGLPSKLIQKIESIEGRSIHEVGGEIKKPKNWDRESGLALSIINCASNRHDLDFVLIGAGHVMRAPENFKWFTTLQMVELLSDPSKVIGIGFQPYSLSHKKKFKNERLLYGEYAHQGIELFQSPSELPKEVLQKMRTANHSYRKIQPDYSQLFEFFLLVPPID